MVQSQIFTKCITLDQFIVHRLGQLRRKRGFTVSELARRVDMDEGALGKALRGDRGLRAEELVCLCYALGVDVEDICPKSMFRNPEEESKLSVKAPFRL